MVKFYAKVKGMFGLALILEDESQEHPSSDLDAGLRRRC
jgi:hypothetical protein